MSDKGLREGKSEVWRGRVEEQMRSGLTVRVFCGERGISEWALHYWRRKLRREQGEQAVRRFVAVRSGPQGLGDAPRIHLPNGVRVELGAGLESGVVRQFLLGLCGVGQPPKDGHGAKP